MTLLTFYVREHTFIKYIGNVDVADFFGFEQFQLIMCITFHFKYKLLSWLFGKCFDLGIKWFQAWKNCEKNHSTNGLFLETRKSVGLLFAIEISNAIFALFPFISLSYWSHC